MVFKEFDSHQLSTSLTKFFLMFPYYPFNVCRICNAVPSFLGLLICAFFLFLDQSHQGFGYFINLFQEPIIGCVDFF